MRGADGGDARAFNNTLETINAAATAVASVQNRHHPHVQKRNWGSWLTIYWCFGHRKNNRKRIGHAVLVTETTPSSGANAAATTISSTTPATSNNITLPFAAPPSSPASFLNSEPPSVAQSPGRILSLTSLSANMYSPSASFSIFSIGPYAYETQLVSPPVFSTFTTEPSTAPFTPFTTPSSPEVPFAQLLDTNNKVSDTYQRFQISHYDIHSYQLHPGSPVGQLISPRSPFSASGTSSPLPDTEFTSRGSLLLDPPKLQNFDKFSIHENHKTHQGSGSVNFSIQGSAQEVLRRVENKPVTWTKALAHIKSDALGADTQDSSRQVLVTETANDAPQQSMEDGDTETIHHNKDECITFSSAKEFNFDNAEGGDYPAPNIVAEWWANEKVASNEGESSHNWSFFPIIQPRLG